MPHYEANVLCDAQLLSRLADNGQGMHEQVFERESTG
jgi:hypothetical protein